MINNNVATRGGACLKADDNDGAEDSGDDRDQSGDLDDVDNED